MRAPFCAGPFETATAVLPPRFASDFARFTNWLVPKVSAAGRFSLDMVRRISFVVVPVEASSGNAGDCCVGGSLRT